MPFNYIFFKKSCIQVPGLNKTSGSSWPVCKSRGGGELTYIGHKIMGMCCCEGYGFQAVLSQG